MITSSYQDLEQYTASVEESFDPRVTPSEPILRSGSKELLNPNNGENLEAEYPNDYRYDSERGAARPEQGWVTASVPTTDHTSSGGFVRNAILSGSYGELRKLRVDSEINSETVTTSWSASVGENLRVGNNAAVAGYAQIGNTQSLVSSSVKGVDPTPGFAPNDENVSDLRLVVSNSALIQDRLYVGKSASISGGLDVKEDVRVARNLYVTGNTEITGNAQIVGHEAVTGSLHVSKSIYGSENFYLTGNSYVTGNSQVVGNEAVTGSLHVSESIYGSENFYLTGNAEVTGTLRVVNNAFVTGNIQVVGSASVTKSLHVADSIYGAQNFYLSGNAQISESLEVSGNVSVTHSAFIKENLFVTGNASVTGTLNVSGNTDLHSNLVVDHSASVLDLTVRNDARINRNLGVTGNEYLTGSLYVGQNAVVTQSLFVNGESFLTGDVHIYNDLEVVGDTHISGDLEVEGDAEISKSLAVSGNVSVTHSVFVKENLFVIGNASVTGAFDVSGNANLHQNLVVGHSASVLDLTVRNDARIDRNLGLTGDAYITGSTYIDKDLVVTKSLYVNDDAVVSKSLHVDQNLLVAGNSKLSGNLEVSQSAAISGNLSVTQSTHISGNLYVSGNTVLTSSLTVVGTSSLLGDTEFGNDVHVLGNVTIEKNINVKGTASYINTQDLYVKDKSITIACGSVSPAQADGAGIDIAGANAEFRYTSSTDRMGLNKGLDIKGDENVTGSLAVTGDAKVSQSLAVIGNVSVTESLFVQHSASVLDLYVTNSAKVNNDLTVTDDVTVGGDENIGGNLGVAGNEELSGTLHVSQNTQLDSDLDVKGNTKISKSLAVSGNAAITGNLSVAGDTIFGDDLHVSGSIYGSQNFFLTGNAQVTGNLGVRGNVDIESSHFAMSGASILNGTMSVDNKITAPLISSSNEVVTPVLRVNDTAHINTARVTQSYVSNETVTQSLVLTQSVSSSQISNSVVTQSLVLTQSVSHSTVLSQSVSYSVVQTQSVVTQSVSRQDITSSSVQQLDVKSGSFQDIQIVSGAADYFDIKKKFVVSSTESSDFGGNVHVHGNVSASGLGHFEYLRVEDNASVGGNIAIGNSASIDNKVVIGGADGTGAALEIQTGSVQANQSDFFVHNVTGSGNLYMSGAVSASVYYGDGRYLRNVTASAASSSTWKSYLDFEAGASQRLYHPFNTTDVFVQVYKWDDPNFHPSLESGSSFSQATRVDDVTVKVVDQGVVDIYSDTKLNGYAVISDAGMIITASVDLLQVATETASYSNVDAYAIYRFEHKLGTPNVIVSVYQYADPKDGSGIAVPIQIFPEQISIPDNSHIDIVFGRQGISGYVVIAKAGHVIKQFDIGDYIDTWNIHWGVSGNWNAHSFTADTHSSLVSVAQEYVDTPRVGNRDTNPHYYYASCSWGSYTEYTDIGINEYVRYSLDDMDVRQVSNIDKEGNLTIRGNLITNGSFSTSDIRKKDVTGPIEKPLEGLTKINGVRFNWKDSGKPSIGVIAQEISAIYPELTKVVPDLDGQEQMVVNYEGLIGVLVEAVKELNSKVKNLEDKLANENR